MAAKRSTCGDVQCPADGGEHLLLALQDQLLRPGRSDDADEVRDAGRAHVLELGREEEAGDSVAVWFAPYS